MDKKSDNGETQESFVSRFDPERETVGKIYRDAQLNNSAEGLTVGEINREMVNSLVDDLNDAIQKNPYQDRPYYIQIAEKLDLMLKKAVRRIINTSLYRPYPEDGTLVFWTNPVDHQVRFCWDLPHHNEHDNILMNPDLYPDHYRTVKAYKLEDAKYFGFWKERVWDKHQLKFIDAWWMLENAHLQDKIIQTV